MYAILVRCGNGFDRFAEHWESPEGQKHLASGLVFFFIAAVGVIELNRWGLLPPPFDRIFSRSQGASSSRSCRSSCCGTPSRNSPTSASRWSG